MNEVKLGQVAPLEASAEMLAAAEQARLAGEDFSGQYRAAMRAYTLSLVNGLPSKKASPVPEERGAKLQSDLEDGMASPVGQDLFQQIIQGNKRRALKILAEECMAGQDAKDLYEYLRHKWVGHSLTIIEVPVASAEEIARQVYPDVAEGGFDGPTYLIRQGLSVTTAMATCEHGYLRFYASKLGWVDLKNIQQLWMVA